MGDLLRALGQGEQARAFFQKSLDIRERLVRQETDSGDLQFPLSWVQERGNGRLELLTAFW